MFLREVDVGTVAKTWQVGWVGPLFTQSKSASMLRDLLRSDVRGRGGVLLVTAFLKVKPTKSNRVDTSRDGWKHSLIGIEKIPPPDGILAVVVAGIQHSTISRLFWLHSSPAISSTGVNLKRTNSSSFEFWEAFADRSLVLWLRRTY